MKKLWALLLVAMSLCCFAAAQSDLRGYEKSAGWQYVQLGSYPYEADGTVKPLLWRVLEHQDGIALILTEDIIDTSQVLFVEDEKVISDRSYRRINGYEESDLYTYLNQDMPEKILGDNPLRQALVDQDNQGLLFPLTTEQFLTESYGWPKAMYGVFPVRTAVATPYAQKNTRIYVDKNRCSPYWVSTIKSPESHMMQIVGYDGHLSWGAYPRTNIGLRLAARLDTSLIHISAGTGSKEDPFVLEAKLSPVPETSAAPTEQVTEAPVSTEVPLLQNSPENVSTDSDTLLLSFVGDCSIGDSIQYANHSSCYHATIDEKGHAWPFSTAIQYTKADDLTIANLEAVFTTRTRSTDKRYNLIAAPDHVQCFVEGSVEVVNTVNNHAMDFFIEGYRDSLATLDEAGIVHFGTVYPGKKNGSDIYPMITVKGVHIGFVGFSYPQESDLNRIKSRIDELKEQGSDLIIVSLHWGRETHMTPQSWQYAFAKKVIDFGADLIWGHHPHVLQPFHFYNGKPIMYSTGNFTFGTMSKVDPSTGIFQFTYQIKNDGIQLSKMQVIPYQTQHGPEYRPLELTEPTQQQEVFSKLMFKKEIKGFENPPPSFLENGIVLFDQGIMQK